MLAGYFRAYGPFGAFDVQPQLGIDFRFADMVGMKMGQDVADWVADRYFKLA